MFLKLGMGALSLFPFNFAYGESQDASIDNKRILFTFDDDPYDLDRTRELVAVLKKHDCKSQFYLTGNGIGKFPQSVEYILSKGYDVGWHSMNHDVMSRKNDSDFLADILSWKKTLKEAAPSYEPAIGRFPYGRGRRHQIRILSEEGMSLQPCATKGACATNWDVDTLDWNPYRALSIHAICYRVFHIQRKHDSPVIVLFHLSLSKPMIYNSLTGRRTRRGDLIIPESALTGQCRIFESIVDSLCGVNAVPFSLPD